MPIRIPTDLPALDILNGENIFAMDMDRAANQDIRPMEVGILNLMPNKIETEVQILRLLSNTPLQINIDLIRIDNQLSKIPHNLTWMPFIKHSVILKIKNMTAW